MIQYIMKYDINSRVLMIFEFEKMGICFFFMSLSLFYSILFSIDITFYRKYAGMHRVIACFEKDINVMLCG